MQSDGIGEKCIITLVNQNIHIKTLPIAIDIRKFYLMTSGVKYLHNYYRNIIIVNYYCKTLFFEKINEKYFVFKMYKLS